MNFPTIITDNFFTEPNKIITASKKLIFKKAQDGRWPGARSELLHKVNNNLFLHVCTKILSIMYPMNHLNLYFEAESTFQKIDSSLYDEGWVHNDANVNIFTAIVYLSEHKNCGTNLYHPKDDIFEACILSDRHNPNAHYLDTKDAEKRKLNRQLCKENNSQYEETVHVNSRFNRLLIFDANHYHAAQPFNNIKGENKERLTLITFFRKISLHDRYLKLPLDGIRNHY